MRYCILFGIFLFVNIAFGQVYDIVVDAHGTGDFNTIGEAISSIPNNQEKRTLILVKNGVYQEKLIVSSSKTFVSIIGEDVNNVIITWSDYQGKDGMFGADSYTLLAEGADFYMENITVVNGYGPGAQAVAIRTTGDRQVFKNCVFKGHQDTYYAHKNRQYNFKCHIEGNTDFIYGDATAVFDSCNIHSIAGGQY
ncbi:MAG TPA: pectinesterase family protein, partial [Marinilabiliaceae bacterium]|nr:pectinesterase family protein [Marinilabiliaceae bacterium]